MSDDWESFFSDEAEHPEKKKPVAKKKRSIKRPSRSAKVKKKARPRTESVKDTRDHLQEVKWFFEDIEPGDTPIFIGIDPGSEGAIGLIHPNKASRHTAVDIPTVQMETSKKTKKGNKAKRTVYDIGQIWQYFEIIKEWRHRVVICLEKTQSQPQDTPLTAYSMGAAYNMWPLFLHSHGLVMEDIIPSVWKRKMGLLKQDKEASRLAAQKLFPMAPLSRKGDHNRAEALLIAEAIRRRRSE